MNSKLVKGKTKIYEKQIGSLGLLSLEKKKLKGDLIAADNFPKEDSRAGGADLSLVTSIKT